MGPTGGRRAATAAGRDRRPERLPGARFRHRKQHGRDDASRVRRRAGRERPAWCRHGDHRGPGRGPLGPRQLRRHPGRVAARLGRGHPDRRTGCAHQWRARSTGGSRPPVTFAYAAVQHPVEGTMLSVSRAAEQATAVLPPDAGLGAVVCAARDAAIVALAHTPSQLAVLAEAGVVDAGGFGLVVILDALCAVVTGEPHWPASTARSSYPAPTSTPAATRETASDHLGYEVQYILGRRLRPWMSCEPTWLGSATRSPWPASSRTVERPRPCRRRRRRDRGGLAGGPSQRDQSDSLGASEATGRPVPAEHDVAGRPRRAAVVGACSTTSPPAWS